MTAPAHVRTCYVHPDRVAGITCQRCDRPICPACMHQASVGFHCPACATRGGQQVYRGVASLRLRPVATQVLIALNVAIYVGTVLTAGSSPSSRGGRGLVRIGFDGGFFADGALVGSFVPHEAWRLVTSGFLHAGVLHLALNMWVLWVLGQFLEPALGRVRFLALYGAALLAGGLGVVVLDPTAVTVGASGAVYGLMGGALFAAREHRVDLMRSGLIPTLAINLLLTFSIRGISIGGHLGGLVGGLLCGLLLVEGVRRWGRRGPALAVAATAASGVGFAVAAYLLMASQYG